MKNFSLVFFVFLLISGSLFSQTKVKEIPFELIRSNVSGAAVGGDLVLEENRGIVCTTKNSSEQTLFQTSGTSQTVYVEIANQDGNSCVTLVVRTSSGTQKMVVPLNSTTGVLRFDRVNSMTLLVELYSTITNETNFESKGTASVWF